MGKQRDHDGGVPSSVHVSPFTLSIREVPNLAAAAKNVGCYLGDHGEILIDPVQEDMAKRDTVVHEILHAMWAQTPFSEAEALSEAEEAVVRTLAPRILALLRDNPDLVDYLTA